MGTCATYFESFWPIGETMCLTSLKEPLNDEANCQTPCLGRASRKVDHAGHDSSDR